MPLLFFPNSDALRLALASGIVPAEVARQEVPGELDEAGRPWVEVPLDFPATSLAALQRIGVTTFGLGSGPTMRRQHGWAELLALKRTSSAMQSGPALLELPDHLLSSIVADVRRLCPQPISIRLLHDSCRAWMTLQTVPHIVHERVKESEGAVFVQAGPNVWIESGWSHPLPDLLASPLNHTLLLRAGGAWQAIADESSRTLTELYALPTQKSDLQDDTTEVKRHPVSLRLLPSPLPKPNACFWMMEGEPGECLARLITENEERLLRRVRVAACRTPSGWNVTLVQLSEPACLLVGMEKTVAFYAHPELPHFYLPIDYAAVPSLRLRVLAELLQLDVRRITWLIPEANGAFRIVSLADEAFQPLSDRFDYAVSPTVKLSMPASSRSPFTCPTFRPALDPNLLSDSASGAVIPPAVTTHVEVPPTSRWLGRSLHLLTKRLLPFRSPTRAEREAAPELPSRRDSRGRADAKLASRQMLLHGHNATAHRRELEQRVLAELPTMVPTDRASLWAELGEVYLVMNQPADAVVCWLNAVWDSPDSPSSWIANWLFAEAKTARIPQEELEFEWLVAAPANAATARVIAAALCWSASLSSTQPIPELGVWLPQLLERVKRFEEELPARAVWLTHRAAAMLSQGDALGLARSRDRLFRRLTETGPGLDLDAPSFLRFGNNSSGEYSQSARDWIVRIREPMQRWLSRMNTKGRLQWAGIDPESNCTSAYADLMLAWGLSRLGDRTRSRAWESQAEAVLERGSGIGSDPVVHQVLLAAFRERIRAAQDGRVNRPGLPLAAAAELPRLDDLARYSVEKLRSASGILESIDLVNPYRGRDRQDFLGTDPLGERLTRLLARPDLIPEPNEARTLLSMAEADPTAMTLPRVIYALLEVAPRLDSAIVAKIVPQAGRATELISEWVRLRHPPGNEVSWSTRVGHRILLSACHAASHFHLPDAFRRVVVDLMDTRGAPGTTAGRLFEPIAGRFFRTLRKLGLNEVATDFLQHVQPAAIDAERVEPHHLGLAIGWFAIGEEEAGDHILNEARKRLFEEGIHDRRKRTEFALAYASALGHASSSIALGRLEELFLRLDSIATHGATNRYYTLKPLELVDTVVRSVVSEDFSLGPGVRGWLDDDEYLIRRRISRELEEQLEG